MEIKSTAVIKPNPVERAKNRSFCAEVARLLKAMGALLRHARQELLSPEVVAELLG